jgi:hypothetical protein|tara:strand:+ start:333 stop:710 length:378 start_codon:yes stop_codon:yes gene_type:complete
MGELKKWLKQKWVRIGTDGEIKGECGTSKNKKSPDRCLPKSKAQSLSKAERAKTARKKKREGAKGKTVVKNTEKATVKNLMNGGEVTRPKRKFNGKSSKGTAVARGCGAIMSHKRKKTKGAVTQS